MPNKRISQQLDSLPRTLFAPTSLTDETVYPILVDVNGNLLTRDNGSGLSIAEGKLSGYSFVHKFGAAPDFDTGDGEITVWDGAEDNVAWENMVYDYSATADIAYATSASTADTVSIEVQGLDGNYTPLTQTVTLTGQTSVTFATNYIRVFRIKNVDSTNLDGHVFVSSGIGGAGGVPTAATIRAIVHPENNQTEMAVYTVPAGKTGYLRRIYASTTGGIRASNYIIRLKARPFGQVFQLKFKASISDDAPLDHVYEEPEKFTEKTDIEVTAETTETNITASAVIAGFDIVLVDN
jgi:hypothetical protein